jgi:hypothetical protein
VLPYKNWLTGVIIPVNKSLKEVPDVRNLKGYEKYKTALPAWEG